MDADNSFYVKYIATYAPTFFGYIISDLAMVLADENEIDLESKENIKKSWSSKSNPSKLAWLLRLKKGKQEFLVTREN